MQKLRLLLSSLLKAGEGICLHLFPIRCGSQYTQLGLLGLDEMKPVNLLTPSLAHCNPSLPLLLISNEALGGSSDLEFVLQECS